LIKRLLYYQLIALISISSYVLPNEQVNAEKIEVKLNISPNLIDRREWISYKGGEKITSREFWRLLGNEEYVNKFDKHVKESKNNLNKILLMPIKVSGYFIGGMIMFASGIVRECPDGCIYMGCGCEDKIKPHFWLGFPLLGMSVYEFYIGFKNILNYSSNITISNSVSYYEVLPLVKKYNLALELN